MRDNQSLEILFQEIRDLCVAEYKRGAEDTRASILKAVESDIGPEKKPTQIALKALRVQAQKSPKPPKMVPRGLPDRFVRRVLSEVPDGIAPTAIIEHAKTPMERRIAYATVRGALKRGRDRGEYRNSGGKWFKT